MGICTLAQIPTIGYGTSRKNDKEADTLNYRKLGARITAAALCAVMGSTGTFLMPGTAYAAAYEMVNGNYQMQDGSVIDGVIARGIDVSRWQGDIDWNLVAADDVKFVMMGTRSKGNVDPFFHKNMKEASDAGIRVGAYIYSLAATPQMAVDEADFVLDLVKDYPISFPIAFDAEDSATLGSLPPDQVSEVINAFCGRIREAGYYPIVYANDNWLANKIDMSNMDYDVWVARYEARHKFSDPIMWQATSAGSIDGIKGNVDIDFLYKDLTPNLPANLWRTIGDKTYYYQNYQMQKDTWIDDGTGWFFMNGDGQAATEWLTKAGLTYYLSPVTGRMVTGWKQLSGYWYFFNNSGAMSTGWLNDKGSRYYLGDNGIMATGWLKQDGHYYYLDDVSGKMAAGWKLLDGKWYFLQDTGVMATGWININETRYFLNSDGSMAVGWHEDGSKRYYLTDSGAAATGWKQLNGSWYYFNPEGEMARGWLKADGCWYYLNQDGTMQSGWLNDNDTWYYLSTGSGKMTIGWRQVDGSWYYFNDSGAMATGLLEIGGQFYYLNPQDGRMAASAALDIGGVHYTADANGVCTKADEAPAQQPSDGQSGSDNGQTTGQNDQASGQNGQANGQNGQVNGQNGQTNEQAGQTGGQEIGPGIGLGKGNGSGTRGQNASSGTGENKGNVSQEAPGSK